MDPSWERWLHLLWAFPLVAVVHEAGHGLMGRLVGFYVAAAGVGSGPPYLLLPLGKTFNLFIGVNPLGGGATVAFPARPAMGRTAQALYHYGGVLAQFAFHGALMLGWVGDPDASRWVRPLLMVNGITAAANLLPFRMGWGSRLLQTDGALGAEALGGRGLAELPAPQVVAALAREARPRVGTAVGNYVLDLCIAASGHPLPPGFRWDSPPPPGTPAIYVERRRLEEIREGR